MAARRSRDFDTNFTLRVVERPVTAVFVTDIPHLCLRGIHKFGLSMWKGRDTKNRHANPELGCCQYVSMFAQ